MQHVGHRASDEVHQLRKQLATAAENFRGTWAALGKANMECTQLSAENGRLREALTNLVASMEGVDTPFTVTQEAAYEAAASLLDDLSPDPA